MSTTSSTNSRRSERAWKRPGAGRQPPLSPSLWPMIKLLRRMGRYITAALTGKFNEVADPKVQLEQAILEAQDQHRRLVEQAANVIANQKQTEMRLNRSMDELEKLNGSTRQAVMMADDATKRNDTTKATEYTQAAEAFANRLIATEKEVEALKTLHLQSAQAAD